VQENAEQNGIPREENAIYLADASYRLGKGYLTLYENVRFTLQEQAAAQIRLQTNEQLCNLEYSQLQNLIELIFSVVCCWPHILDTSS